MGASVHSGKVPLDNQWHLVAVTVKRAPNGITFYLDGVPGSKGDPSPFPGSVTPPAAIPIYVSHPDGGFDGCIDEVQLFNRALDPAEITAIYQAGNLRKDKSNP